MGRLSRAEKGISLSDRLSIQSHLISQMAEFLEDFNEGHWQKIKERLEIRLKQLQNVLESGYMDMSADQLKAAIAAIVEVKNFMHMPEDTKARISKLNEARNRMREELRAAAKK